MLTAQCSLSIHFHYLEGKYVPDFSLSLNYLGFLAVEGVNDEVACVFTGLSFTWVGDQQFKVAS